MDKQLKSALTRMAASILRPLIKVLMRHDFSHSELTELVRKTYVEVAYDAFKIPNHKMTYSRAALLTGLSRKEVVRLRRQIELSNSPQLRLSYVAKQVVQGWLTDNDYLDDLQNPRQLPLKGAQASFANLVSKYAGTVSFSSLLDELGRCGITSQNSFGVVELTSDGKIPMFEELERIRVMSVCVSDLFGTAVHDLNSSNNDIRFQRQLVYSGIEENLARRFHDVGSEKAMALFKTLNEFLFSGGSNLDPMHRETGKRVGLGIYYFEGAKQVKSVKMTSDEYA